MALGSTNNVAGTAVIGLACTIQGPSPYVVQFGPANPSPTATPLPAPGVLVTSTQTLPSQVEYAANVTGATGNGVSPIVLTIDRSTSPLSIGNALNVANVGGNQAANGAHTISALGANTITLENASTGNGAYTSGGTLNAPGVFVPQQSAVPLTTRLVMRMAAALQAEIASAANSANVPPQLAQYLSWVAYQDYQRNGGT